jgi:hypothetical protein
MRVVRLPLTREAGLVSFPVVAPCCRSYESEGDDVTVQWLALVSYLGGPEFRSRPAYGLS